MWTRKLVLSARGRRDWIHSLTCVDWGWETEQEFNIEEKKVILRNILNKWKEMGWWARRNNKTAFSCAAASAPGGEGEGLVLRHANFQPHLPWFLFRFSRFLNRGSVQEGLAACMWGMWTTLALQNIHQENSWGRSRPVLPFDMSHCCFSLPATRESLEWV